MTNFINLAGDHNADNYIREELFLAGLDPVVEKSRGEVPYSLIARYGDWKFTRAWRYWIVKIDDTRYGLPLKTALTLHNRPHPTKGTMGNVIRAGGHAGALSPDEYGANPVYDKDLTNKLVKLGFKKGNIAGFDEDIVNISVGEVSKLCNSGKLDVKRYVDCYHVDDQIGLNELVYYLKL